MQDFVRRKNIELYKQLLANDQLDEAHRQYVEKMLAEELAKDLPPERSEPSD